MRGAHANYELTGQGLCNGTNALFSAIHWNFSVSYGLRLRPKLPRLGAYPRFSRVPGFCKCGTV